MSLPGFHERIEACLDLLGEKVERYLTLADEATERGEDILAFKYHSVAQGVNEAALEVRKARVPDSIRGVLDEILERPHLRVVGK
jgi:hypothetical protein